MKDKGEREKRGPEASGLTPVERGRERKEGCKPFSLLRGSQKGSQGLVGSPRAKTAHWRSPAWVPQWPSSCSSPACPPAVCLVIGWERWEGRPWCVYCRRSQSLGSCQPHSPWQVLLKGGLSSTLRSGAERSHLAQVRGPDREEDTLCPSLWTRQPHPCQGQFLGSGLSPEGNLSILTFKLPGNPSDQRVVCRILH